MKARTPSHVGRRRVQRVAYALAAASLSIVVACSLLESALCLFTSRGTSLFAEGRYRPNYRGRIYSPESGRVVDMRFNADGFRGPTWPLEMPAAGRRIAFVGDSFVAAVAVQESETFVDRVEKQLQSDTAGGVECMNFGVSGRDLADYLMHYRLFVRQYRPDTVIVCFYHGNDLRGRWPELGDPKAPIDYARMRTPDTPGLNGWLLGHSRLYNWYTATSRAARDRLRELAVRMSPDAYYGSMRERFERRWEDYRIFLSPPDAATDECWKVIAQHLAAMQQLVASDGARLLIVGIPAEEQVCDADWRRLCQEGGKEDERGWSRLEPDRQLGAIADRLGIDYLPLLDALSSATGDDCYYGRGHLTPAGHAVAATAIVQRLRQIQVQLAAHPNGAVLGR